MQTDTIVIENNDYLHEESLLSLIVQYHSYYIFVLEAGISDSKVF